MRVSAHGYIHISYRKLSMQLIGWIEENLQTDITGIAASEPVCYYPGGLDLLDHTATLVRVKPPLP